MFKTKQEQNNSKRAGEKTKGKSDLFDLQHNVSAEILGNLTLQERNNLHSLHLKLDKIKEPKKPLSAQDLFFDQSGTKRGGYGKKGKNGWENLPDQQKQQFEEKASELMRKYREDHETVQKLSESLWAEINEIKAHGDMSLAIKCKKMSPYRVYKRETAAQIKQEFPLMSNEERSQIVKERWRTIDDKQKAIFVALARVEEEKLTHDAIQSFYKERIETTRKHAGMKPVDLSDMQIEVSEVDGSDFQSDKEEKYGNFQETSMNTTNATQSRPDSSSENELGFQSRIILTETRQLKQSV